MSDDVPHKCARFDSMCLECLTQAYLIDGAPEPPPMVKAAPPEARMAGTFLGRSPAGVLAPSKPRRGRRRMSEWDRFKKERFE